MPLEAMCHGAIELVCLRLLNRLTCCTLFYSKLLNSQIPWVLDFPEQSSVFMNKKGLGLFHCSTYLLSPEPSTGSNILRDTDECWLNEEVVQRFVSGGKL